MSGDEAPPPPRAETATTFTLRDFAQSLIPSMLCASVELWNYTREEDLVTVFYGELCKPFDGIEPILVHSDEDGGVFPEARVTVDPQRNILSVMVDVRRSILSGPDAPTAPETRVYNLTAMHAGRLERIR